MSDLKNLNPLDESSRPQLHWQGALMAIAARQFDPLVSFYSQLLERSPVTLIPGVYAEFQLPGLTLGIFRPKAPPSDFSRPQPRPQGISLCLEVEDLDNAIAHLTHLGCPPAGPVITASHGREIYAYDPESNWLILHESPKPNP